MLSTKFFTRSLAAILFIAAANPAQAVFDQYSVTDLGSLVTDPNNPNNYSYAFDINDRGDVVGYSKGADGLDHAFIRLRGQTMVDLGEGRATSINNHREFVGWGAGPNYILWKPQATGFFATDLGILSAHVDNNVWGQTIKINEQGDLAGTTGYMSNFYWKEGVLTESFGGWTGCTPSSVVGLNNQGNVIVNGVSLYHSVTMTESPVPLFEGYLGAFYLVALNDTGEMVGTTAWGRGMYYSKKNGYHILPENSKTGLFDINNSGLAVGGGHYAAYSGLHGAMASSVVAIKAVIAEPSTDTFAYLNDLTPNSGWNFKLATAINNAGQIVGVGINPQGKYHAFLLTPTTPP